MPNRGKKSKTRLMAAIDIALARARHAGLKRRAAERPKGDDAPPRERGADPR